MSEKGEALPEMAEGPKDADLSGAARSWRAAYFLVLAALAVDIALLWLLGVVYA